MALFGQHVAKSLIPNIKVVNLAKQHILTGLGHFDSSGLSWVGTRYLLPKIITSFIITLMRNQTPTHDLSIITTHA